MSTHVWLETMDFPSLLPACDAEAETDVMDADVARSGSGSSKAAAFYRRREHNVKLTFQVVLKLQSLGRKIAQNADRL